MTTYWQDEVPRIAVSTVFCFEEMKKCLLPWWCDSWALKAVAILTHAAFVLGFASPSRLIFRILKSCFKRVFTKTGELLDDNTELEYLSRTMIAIFCQILLELVWALVRNSSLCMRNNSCDNDFMAQINNIKIKVCGIDNPSDTSRRTLTTCELFFNDSPLLVLAGVMLIAMALSSAKLKQLDLQEPQQNKVADSQSNDNLLNNPNPTQASSELASSQANVAPNPLPNNDETNANDQKPLQENEQLIRALCHKCNRQFNCTVPRPWPLYCAENFPLIEKRQATGKKTSSLNSDTATELRGMLKQIKCLYCKTKIRKVMKDIQKRKRKPSK
ncbi:unnamed protein product [Orchesella dallaii]|uniref:Uncharacterized protein n=1 Tax=Orchesella dallaii TaxID=48710 RepID=A0ABP1QFU9_9HEXA